MAEVREHLQHVDGVMLGRVAYHEPEILLAVDSELYGEEPPVADAFEAVEAYEPYVAARLAEGERLHAMTRHMLGLFTGRPGARAYRRHLATEATKPGANLRTLRDAVAHVSRTEAQPSGLLASAASA
jgi:tRNA-dihydrouridine synthase A